MKNLATKALECAKSIKFEKGFINIKFDDNSEAKIYVHQMERGNNLGYLIKEYVK